MEKLEAGGQASFSSRPPANPTETGTLVYVFSLQSATHWVLHMFAEYLTDAKHRGVNGDRLLLGNYVTYKRVLTARMGLFQGLVTAIMTGLELAGEVTEPWVCQQSPARVVGRRVGRRGTETSSHCVCIRCVAWRV